jgi:hypothetical protein
MTPKITNEMRDALHRSNGRPVDVEDEQAQAMYVLIDKSTFAHLQEVEGMADEATRKYLRSLVEDGIKSGKYQPADTVFEDLRRYAEQLSSRRQA